MGMVRCNASDTLNKIAKKTGRSKADIVTEGVEILGEVYGVTECVSALPEAVKNALKTREIDFESREKIRSFIYRIVRYIDKANPIASSYNEFAEQVLQYSHHTTHYSPEHTMFGCLLYPHTHKAGTLVIDTQILPRMALFEAYTKSLDPYGLRHFKYASFYEDLKEKACQLVSLPSLTLAARFLLSDNDIKVGDSLYESIKERADDLSARLEVRDSARQQVEFYQKEAEIVQRLLGSYPNILVNPNVGE